MSFNPLLVRPHFDDDMQEEETETQKKEEEMKLLEKIKTRKEKSKKFFADLKENINKAKTYLKNDFEAMKKLPLPQKILIFVIVTSIVLVCDGIVFSSSILFGMGLCLFGLFILFAILVIINLAIKLHKKKKGLLKNE